MGRLLLPLGGLKPLGWLEGNENEHLAQGEEVIANSTSASRENPSRSFLKSFSGSVHGRTFSLATVVGVQRRFVAT